MTTRKTSANENSLGESAHKKKASASKAKSANKAPAAHKSFGTESKHQKCSVSERRSHEAAASETHQRLLHEKEIGLITNVLCRVEKRLDALESAESKSSASESHQRLLHEKEIGLITNVLCRVEKQLDALENAESESSASELHQRLLHEKEVGLITHVLCRVEKQLTALEDAESKSSVSESHQRLLHEKEVGLITNVLCRVEKQLNALEGAESKSLTPHTASESKCVEFSVPDYEKEIGFSENFRRALFDFSATMFHGKRPSSFAVYFVDDGVCYVRYVHCLTGLDSVEDELLLSMCGHNSSQTFSIALSQVHRIVAVN